ncbi:ribonuclease P protein component [Candidatus Dependentiae bacterium]|nr:ribonuclease P protein component [Candidatus Dependentiae bacterium]
MKFKELFRFEKKEIDQVFKNAKQIDKIEGLKLLQSPAGQNQNFGKLLIIASKKVGKAHKRNKIRRQLKSIFYQENLFKNPVNSIILVYKSALNLKFEELKEFLIKNLKINEKN